ncbi:PIR Superfamily Protein [Plasmodium ovale wallikeri]|uniref:PIR Superfamily Protein n=2 Tax=Plasmodium ovale TaxID=36330 RepID=A0A1A9AMG4_PLAOA|nr:PIR Superfamily Protein [Plasmodium ovale wallikeri]SBT58947.1 PIR Superfamily Protein [Plasmodium ovale wallikeri]SBT71955.1 Plasmodium vivax Vir protein, putative [Plasmodium ovale]
MGGEDDGEEDDYVSGDNYYFSVSTFLQYEDEFNTVTNGSIASKDYVVDCKGISTTHFHSHSYSDICDKVAKYLYYIKQKSEEDYDNRCRCLNYLLNTKIEFKTFSDKTCSEIFAAHNAILSELETCNSKIGCIPEEDIEKIKKLHDLHNSFTKLTKSLEDNNENIYSTAEEFALLYKSAITGCESLDTEGYCEALKEFEVLCDHHAKSKNCSEIANLLKYQHELKKSFKIVFPCIMVLGIPFISYIMYKFTPFRSWINTFLIKNKIIRHNLNEEDGDQYFQDTYEHSDIENMFNSHNIGYHAT